MTIRTDLIEYVHDGTTLAGYLAWDDSISGARPGILVSHAWAGRSQFENSKAEDLAKLGYAGFALDLYGKGVLGAGPDENAKLMQPFLDDRVRLSKRLAASHDTMCSADVVDKAQTAIMGYCFGGLCALDAARTGLPVHGAISLHGLFAAMGTTQKIKAKVLALHGWDDPMAPPEAVMEFSKEMTAAQADWQLHAYGNTMHAFTNPQANNADMGTVYDADADRRSWIAVQNFLAELF